MIFRSKFQFAALPENIRRSFFVATLLFSGTVPLFSISGCKQQEQQTKTEYQKEDLAEMTQAPTPEEIIDARIQYEIASLHAQAMEKDISTIPEPIQEKDLSPTEKVEQLIVEGHLLSAADEAILISDVEQRDSYLEDIVRRLIVQSVRSLKDEFSNSRSVQAADVAEDTVRKADKICQKISSPLIRAEVFGSIGVFCTGQKIPKQAVNMMNKVVSSIDEVQGNALIKARKYSQTAKWFLNHNESQRALDCCVKADKEADHIDNAFEAAVLYLDLVDSFLLLNKNDKVKILLEKSLRQTDKISEPKEKATILLKSASEKLACPSKILGESTKEKNETIKGLVRKTDRLIALHYDENSVAITSPDSALPDNRTKLDVVHDFLTRSLVWSWREIKSQRNEILAKIAKMQVWTDSLEDAWETILDIETGPERDGAVIEVVDMLLTTEQPDEAEVWTDEISDEVLKKSLIDKIESSKKQPKTGVDP